MIDTTARGYPEGRKSILNGLSFLERKSEIVYERRSKSHIDTISARRPVTCSSLDAIAFRN